MTDKYLFADESGNFDFRDHTKYPGASKYFAVGTLLLDGEDSMRALREDLGNLRYELLAEGAILGEHFHATEDKQVVRDAVFEVLQDHRFKVDVTILEKAKAQPQARTTDPVFYKYAWYYHFKNFAARYFAENDKLTVVAGSVGTKKTKRAFKGAVEDVVEQCSPRDVDHGVAFWPTSTDYCLQAADYALWAVMRDIEQGDPRSRKLLESKINSVYDLWSIGRKYHYGPNAT